MHIFSAIKKFIGQVIRRMIPARDIESAERVETALTEEFQRNMELWRDLYTGKAPWLFEENMRTLNLPALIASEIARLITLEVKWNITGPAQEGGSEAVEEAAQSPRAEYLKQEFSKVMNTLREKVEQACAAGGMVLRPYVKGGHIYFDWTMQWDIYPIAFDDDGNLSDVVFPDIWMDGETVYTRLERHQATDQGVVITNRAFKSRSRDALGVEIPLEEVPRWADIAPQVELNQAQGQMFGWFRVAAANNIDIGTPLGVSVFHKAIQTIEDADRQHSRILWEYEGSELAVFVDPLALRPVPGEEGIMDLPPRKKRLFRAIRSHEDGKGMTFYTPPIRDAAQHAELNRLKMAVEDLCGISRGLISDANVEARTATELRIMRTRSYTTVADNQKALERCLRDVVRAMDEYATWMNLAPQGEYELSFEWDDSISTDTQQQLAERLELLAQGVTGKTEMRQWYFGETKAQARKSLAEIEAESESKSAESILEKSRKEGGADDEDADIPTPEQGADDQRRREEDEKEPAAGRE